MDSTVRIQIGRLRQKLSEYYRAEGKGDRLVVELPKGRFSLICEPRSGDVAAPASVETTPEPTTAPPRSAWRIAALTLAGLCLTMLAVAIYSYWKLRTEQNVRQPLSALWSPDIEELWRPFLNTGRPLIIVVGNPLFLQFENKALYRDLSIEKPDDLLKSPQFGAVSKALGSRESRPVHYYAAVGDVNAMFLLGQRLGPHHPGMSVVRSSQLKLQQLALSHVLFLGPPRFFLGQLC